MVTDDISFSEESVPNVADQLATSMIHGVAGFIQLQAGKMPDSTLLQAPNPLTPICSFV
jgi:hypothetical protein